MRDVHIALYIHTDDGSLDRARLVPLLGIDIRIVADLPHQYPG